MTQYARPNSDISAGGWSYSTGSSLFECINEVTPSDTDYIEGEVSETCDIGLSTVTDPVSSSSHHVSFRAFANGGGPGERLTVTLRQGSTEICTVANNIVIARAWTLYEYNLTSGEADSITDYSALYLRFYVGTAAAVESIRVSFAEFDCPDASGPSPVTVSLNTSAMSITGESIVLSPGEVKIPLSVASLAILANNISVSLVSEIIISLNTAVLQATAESFSLIPGEARIPLTELSLQALAESLSLIPGPVQIPLNELILQVLADNLTLLPGEVIIPLDTGLISITAETLGVSSGGIAETVISLNSANLSISAESLSVIPGEVSIPLLEASLQVIAESLSLNPGEVKIQLSELSLQTLANDLNLLPGEVKIPLQVASISIIANPVEVGIGIIAPTVIQLNTAEMSISIPGLLVFQDLDPVTFELQDHTNHIDLNSRDYTSGSDLQELSNHIDLKSANIEIVIDLTSKTNIFYLRRKDRQ